MADGGRTDFWAPDSTLEAQEPGVWYRSADGQWFEVCVNDFIDLDISVPADPIWGQSFQVLECKPKEIMVRMYEPISDLYEPCGISVELVLGAYKLREFHDALPDGAVAADPESAGG